MDALSKNHRSWNMAQIRSKDTKPELVVRRLLFKLGARFRLHRKDLPGCPDIVLPRRRLVIFVNGCFWHRHAGCKLAYSPKSNASTWKAKFKTNVRRDRLAIAQLHEQHWRVSVIWECQTRNPDELTEFLSSVLEDHQ